MESLDGDIEDLSGATSFQFDDESDFIELCGILAEHGEDHLHLYLHKRPTTTSPDHLSGGESEAKRRKREIVVSDALKIPEHDIRRKLPHAFKEIFNSCEQDQLREFLYRYCSENCCSTFRYIGTENPFSQANYTEVVGLPATTAYWESVYNALPDSLFDIVETKFRLLPNKQTSIVCKFLYSGTKVYRLCTDDADSLVYSAPSDDATQDPPGRLIVAQVTSRNPTTTKPDSEAPFHPGTYMTEPVSVAVIGTMLLFTDASNKIFRFEFIYCVKP